MMEIDINVSIAAHDVITSLVFLFLFLLWLGNKMATKRRREIQEKNDKEIERVEREEPPKKSRPASVEVDEGLLLK